jgi:hypothetical protein
MKKLLLLPFILFCFTAFAQKTTKQQDIENLLAVMQVKGNIQKLVDGAIEIYQKQKPAVPKQVWNEIKNNLDYNSFMNKMTAIYDSNYTQAEIKELIRNLLTLKPNQQQPFKQVVQEQAYNLSNEFGKNFSNIVKEQLKSKGY